jgi:hypothetical protein
MGVFSRLGAGLGLFVAFGLACKDSGSPSVTPNTLVRVSGDTQSTITGNTLTSPLTVRVRGSDGQPFEGATVTWTVTAGTATPGSPTALSDASGLASTTLTLGAAPGAITVQAAVASVTPVTFTATACDHPVLALNDTLAGALSGTDCKFGDYYTDFYDLSVPTGSQGVELTMRSAQLGTWLELYLRTGSFVGYDNTINSPRDSAQLTAILATGDYLLAPSSYDVFITGAYTMAALTKPAALAGCGLTWVTPGIDISDSVTTGDCVDSTGRYYADVVAISLVAGTTLKVNHRSTAFDAALFLRSADRITVASNNDSANAGTTTNAFISFPVVNSGLYLLFVGTYDSVATGAYDLSIASTTTLAGSPVERARGPEVLRMGGLRWPKGRAARFWSRPGT